MLKKFDYLLSFLMILFSAGHGFIGTLWQGDWQSTAVLWSFSGSIAAWMIAAVNILRVGRPEDRALAWVAFAGSVAWILLMIWLAAIADMFGDIRIWLFIMTSTGLAVFSMKSALNRAAD